jgi:hypothetical protein
MSRARAIAVVLMLFAAAAIARAAVQAPPMSSRSDLSALPYTIDEWAGAEGAPIDAETLRILSADSVLNRSASTRRCIACRAPGGKLSMSAR